MGLRILYGVQGTGNGHLSRSREIVRCLKSRGHDVRVIVSGRPAERLWDMEDFEPYRVLPGLTFATRRGRLEPLRTLAGLKLLRFYADIRGEDVRGIDLVITDFEPITARIARRHRLPAIGIGHQYAFRHRIPVAGFDPAAWFILRCFAPARFTLGLHWHPFGQPLLPPVLPRLPAGDPPFTADRLLVYLPFEEEEDIRRLLHPFTDRRFVIYHPLDRAHDEGHLRWRLPSRSGFLRALAESAGVITNAGFELASEALQLGKKILVKPLRGQMEQLSNARALSLLGLGSVMKRLDRHAVEEFLARPAGVRVRYPDMAGRIAQWISACRWEETAGLVRGAWGDTVFPAGTAAGAAARPPSPLIPA
ncbi:MAG: glycosyltransferase family protein [Desulfobacterales bacterium]